MRKLCSSKIKNLIFFPSNLGQKKKGVERGPSLISRAIFKKEKQNNFTKSKKVWLNLEKSNSIYDNLEMLYEANDNIKGPRVNIGGDHSMSIATVAHSLNNYEGLKIIWIDAHADINTSYSSDTGNIHGMPLGYLTNLDTNENFYYICNHLPFKDILYIGIRDIDKFENNVIKDIDVIDTDEFNNSKTIDKIDSFVGNNPIHLSLDIDGLDPSYMPSTGTTSDKGLNLDLVKNLLDHLHENKRKQIKNVDICEFNPKIGSSEDVSKTLKNIMYLFDRYI